MTDRDRQLLGFAEIVSYCVTAREELPVGLSRECPTAVGS